MQLDLYLQDSYGGIYSTAWGDFLILSRAEAIIYVNFIDNIKKVDKNLLHRIEQLQTHTWSEQAAQELREYFVGKRKQFDVPLDFPYGSTFQKNVWRMLAHIPYGQTQSYKQIACRLNNPNASRAVGNANNKNPLMIFIPCHRVIGHNKTLAGYAHGICFKQRLLQLEASYS